jgi:hypothetical protein
MGKWTRSGGENENCAEKSCPKNFGLNIFIIAPLFVLKF